MFEGFVLLVEDCHEKIKAVVLGDFENVSSDQFFDEGLPEFGGNLEGIDSEGQKYLDHALNVLICEVLLKSSFVIFDDGFADEFCALNSAFIDDDFVMFSELNLIVFDGFVEGFVFVVALLDIVDYLEQVDGDGEDLSSGLQHFLVLFDLLLVLAFELHLVLALAVGVSHHLLQLGVSSPDFLHPSLL